MSQSMARRHHRIACIPGDGIGPEVIDAALQILQAASQASGEFELEIERLPWGSAYYKDTGYYLPPNHLSTLGRFHAILFGAVGAPDVPDEISLWELLLAIRGSTQLYVNVRPIRCFTNPSVVNTKPEDFDWVFVRENTEGEYSGHGGRSHRNQQWEVGTETSIYTRHGVERIMRFAFEKAQQRTRKHLTVVTKSNALRHGLVFWDEVAAEVAKEFSDVKWDKMLVDAMTVRMVQRPSSIDTVVGTNLHIDILSDLAAVLAGSIGTASSANLDPTRAWPSMFEPVHGSAFDITGKGIANPIGAIWAAADMLSWLGEQQWSERILRSVAKVCAGGQLTPDMGGSLNTLQVAIAIKNEILNAGSMS